MRRIDPVTTIIYTLGLVFLFGMGFIAQDIYERNHRIADHLEAVEPIVEEVMLEVEEPAEIEEIVFESEEMIVSYAPPAEEVVEPEIPEVVETAYFDVPLDDALQDYIFNVCDSYGVDPAIIVAMIGKESTYNPGVIGDSGRSFGLMQIQQRWHEARMARLGVTDLLDPYQNVLVGIDYFAELLSYEQGLTWSLMAYNGGITYANKKTAAGEVSGYVRVVTSAADELRASLEG